MSEDVDDSRTDAEGELGSSTGSIRDISRTDLDYGSTHPSNPEVDSTKGGPSESDGRGTSATGIDDSVVPDDDLHHEYEVDHWMLRLRRRYDNKWEWFSRLNEGVGEGDRSVQNYEADVRRTVDTLCSTMECTDRTRDRVHYLVERAEFKKIHGNAPYEAIVLAYVTLVANERVNGAHSVRFIRQEESYDELLSHLDLSRSTIRSIRSTLTDDDCEYYSSPNA